MWNKDVSVLFLEKLISTINFHKMKPWLKVVVVGSDEVMDCLMNPSEKKREVVEKERKK